MTCLRFNRAALALAATTAGALACNLPPPGDGDGDTTGDSSSAASVSASQSGDGDSSTSGGDGDASTTNGDGDSSTNGDGDSSTNGDGDSATTNGDGDGDGECMTGDGDGDGAIDDPTCEAPTTYESCDASGTDPFRAIGLDCSSDPTTTIPLVTSNFVSAEPRSWRVARRYGLADGCAGEPLWLPTEGEQMLILSTGALRDPDVDGTVTVYMGATEPGIDDNANPDMVGLPSTMNPVDGSNGGAGGTPFMDCDGDNDCSDTLQTQWELGESNAWDLIWFELEADVPVGVDGFQFDLAWFSSEYPEWIDDEFNDVFAVWADGSEFTGNVAFIGDAPVTATSMAPIVQFGPNSPRLVGTGFEGVGGATGWKTVRGPATPGDRIHLVFALFDMGDEQWDTVALLDGFRWDCLDCQYETPEGCGVGPQ